MKVGNQGPSTRWDADGPNGPNTLPNSESIVLDWWTTGDNWSIYRGGKLSNGKTSVLKKESTWKVLSKKIKDAGVKVDRNPKSVGAKLQRMEAEYKRANDFVMNTGQGLLEEGKDITQYVKKLCPFYYELHPIMADRASTTPLASFESEGIESPTSPSNDSAVTTSDDNNDDATDAADDEEASVEDEADDDEPAKKQQKKKRPLSLANTTQKTAKLHPATELLNSLSSAVEKAAIEKMQVKKEELAEKKKIAEEEVLLKKRELDLMEKKVEQEVKKSAVELNMLEIQQKEQLLLTRKRLVDAGVAQDEIDKLLPL